MTQIKTYINIKKSGYLSFLTSLLTHFIIFYPLFTVDKINTTYTQNKKTYVNRVILFGSEKKIDNKIHEIKNKKLKTASKLLNTENKILAELDISTKENYLNTVRKIIEKHAIFPIQAERLNKSGEVIIRLTINKNGSFTNLHFIKNASFEPFNQATKEAVSKIESFPSFPNELKEESIDIEQKFTFLKK